jgi:AcrR family transcriptional regulator
MLGGMDGAPQDDHVSPGTSPPPPADPRRWILEAVEHLLAEIPLHQLTVPVILRESGISRATFYSYFPSKNAAVTAVIAQTMDEIDHSARPWLDDSGLTVADTLRATLEGTATAWEIHGAVLRCLVENWHAIPELLEIWQRNVDRWVEVISTRIDADRAAGLAPPGVDSGKLAAGLIWNGQQFFYLGTLGVDPRLPTIKDAVEAMYPMWLGAIYSHRPVQAQAESR